MESTYNTRVIILNRFDFRENDSRIICYSEDRGKLELVARGAKKLKSKSSGHIEPLTLSNIMVVKGKDVNYAGTATGENFYSNIKEDLDKIFIASQAMSLVDKMTRVGEIDDHEKIFNLLKGFLDNLENGVIPAQAGIQDFSNAGFKLDSRLRGNDNDIEVFSKKLSVIIGFSIEDFNEMKDR
jgi:DNA repair protein RecO (recombination protein O)